MFPTQMSGTIPLKTGIKIKVSHKYLYWIMTFVNDIFVVHEIEKLGFIDSFII